MRVAWEVCVRVWMSGGEEIFVRVGDVLYVFEIGSEEVGLRLERFPAIAFSNSEQKAFAAY